MDYRFSYWDGETNVSELIGKVVTKIDQNEEEVIFYCSDNTAYRMAHEQD